MRRIIFRVLRYSGLPFLLREFVQRNRISILMFHDIDEKIGETVFKYLLKNYNIIDLNEYIKANKQKKHLPKKSLIITFDDGHIKNYDLLPIIKKYQIPITIFLCSHIVNTNRSYWFKYNNLKDSSEYYKKMPNFNRLRKLKKIGFDQDKNYKERQALSMDEINEMKNTVDFQSHTMYHPCLIRCSEDEAFKEISLSKSFLESEYNLDINTIAFPNGDYSDKIIEFTKQSKYACSMTVDHGYNTINSDIFRLKRISTNDTLDINEFVVRSSGLWGFIKLLN